MAGLASAPIQARARLPRGALGEQLVGPERWAVLVDAYRRSDSYDPDLLDSDVESGACSLSWDEETSESDWHSFVMWNGTTAAKYHEEFVEDWERSRGLRNIDYGSSSELNPSKKSLEPEDVHYLAGVDQPLVQAIMDHVATSYFEAIQDVKEREWQAGRYEVYPLLPSGVIAEHPPFPSAKRWINVEIGSSWQFRMEVYEGEYPELDAECRRLLELQAARLDRIRSLIASF